MTNQTPQDAQRKAAATYNAASDFYDHAANSFWELYGRKTIERLGLRPGGRVLDVCCGSGASALPAAQAVRPNGTVLGIDLAEELLDLARAKAAAQGLTNFEFRTGDMLNLGLPDAHFDAVVCVFGIFFVPDMPGAVRELWRMLRPGGKLALTTWGKDLFEPLNSVFWNAVRAVRPDLYKGFNPWERVCEPGTLRAMLNEGGLPKPDIVLEPGTHSIPTPEHAWALILGTGYRGTLEQLAAPQRELVREKIFAFARESGGLSVETGVLYAVADKR
jgi:ubiquinone/menaquinone biosynthesis C-methylase UbiE